MTKTARKKKRINKSYQIGYAQNLAEYPHGCAFWEGHQNKAGQAVVFPRNDLPIHMLNSRGYAKMEIVQLEKNNRIIKVGKTSKMM